MHLVITRVHASSGDQRYDDDDVAFREDEIYDHISNLVSDIIVDCDLMGYDRKLIEQELGQDLHIPAECKLDIINAFKSFFLLDKTNASLILKQRLIDRTQSSIRNTDIINWPAEYDIETPHTGDLVSEAELNVNRNFLFWKLKRPDKNQETGRSFQSRFNAVAGLPRSRQSDYSSGRQIYHARRLIRFMRHADIWTICMSNLTVPITTLASAIRSVVELRGVTTLRDRSDSANNRYIDAGSFDLAIDGGVRSLIIALVLSYSGEMPLQYRLLLKVAYYSELGPFITPNHYRRENVDSLIDYIAGALITGV